MANSEYTNAGRASACSYNKLGNYLGPNSMVAPPRAGQTSGTYLTPNYAPIGYDALTHGRSGSCMSYFNINDAYGSGAGSCNPSYTTRLCGGGGGNVGTGMDWVCTDPKPGGGTCVGVNKGAQRPPGNVYPTSYQCQAGCKSGQRKY